MNRSIFVQDVYRASLVQHITVAGRNNLVIVVALWLPKKKGARKHKNISSEAIENERELHKAA